MTKSEPILLSLENRFVPPPTVRRAFQMQGPQDLKKMSINQLIRVCHRHRLLSPKLAAIHIELYNQEYDCLFLIMGNCRKIANYFLNAKILVSLIDHRRISELLLNTYPKRYTIGEDIAHKIEEVAQFLNMAYSLSRQEYLQVCQQIDRITGNGFERLFGPQIESEIQMISKSNKHVEPINGKFLKVEEMILAVGIKNLGREKELMGRIREQTQKYMAKRNIAERDQLDIAEEEVDVHGFYLNGLLTGQGKKISGLYKESDDDYSMFVEYLLDGESSLLKLQEQYSVAESVTKRHKSKDKENKKKKKKHKEKKVKKHKHKKKMKKEKKEKKKKQIQ